MLPTCLFRWLCFLRTLPQLGLWVFYFLTSNVYALPNSDSASRSFFLKWEYVPLDESLFIRYLWNAQWLTLAQHPPLWKVESKTLRFACRRSIREHSQKQHMRRIRKEEFEEKEDELYNECSGDFGWSHRKLWSWVGSSELLKWSKLARTLWLCISQFLEYSFLSHWKLHIRVGLSWAL